LINGFISTEIIIDLMKLSVKFRENFKEIYISLLFFNERITSDNFTFDILKYEKDLVINQYFLNNIIKNGLIDDIFYIPLRKTFFSQNMIMFLIKDFRSFDFLDSLEIYLSSLWSNTSIINSNLYSQNKNIKNTNPNLNFKQKIDNIKKIKQPLSEEIFNILKGESSNLQIMHVSAKILFHLLNIDSGINIIKNYLAEKKFFEFLITKLNSNYLPLINTILQILAIASNLFQDSEFKVYFKTNLEDWVNRTREILLKNVFFKNQIAIKELLTVNINYLISFKGSKDISFFEFLINPFFIKSTPHEKKIEFNLKGNKEFESKSNLSIKSLFNKKNRKLKLKAKYFFPLNKNKSFIKNLIEKVLFLPYNSKLNILDYENILIIKKEMRFEIDASIFNFFDFFIDERKYFFHHIDLYSDNLFYLNFLILFDSSKKFYEIKNIFLTDIKIHLIQGDTITKKNQTENNNYSNFYYTNITNISMRKKTLMLFLINYLNLLSNMLQLINKLINEIIYIKENKERKILRDIEDSLEDDKENSKIKIYLENDYFDLSDKEKISKINDIFENKLNEFILSLYDFCVDILSIQKIDVNFINVMTDLHKSANQILDNLKRI